MTHNEWVFWIGTTLAIISAASSWTHVILYAVRSKWERTDEGQNLMATMAMLAIVLTYVSVVNVLGPYVLHDYPNRGYIRAAVFGFTTAVSVRWLLILFDNQREARQERKKDNVD